MWTDATTWDKAFEPHMLIDARTGQPVYNEDAQPLVYPNLMQAQRAARWAAESIYREDEHDIPWDQRNIEWRTGYAYAFFRIARTAHAVTAWRP